ncbi:hypothetical protein FA95DRAFT_1577215 [Auriscalpium vulgare]|uniref:Uncharacterized protein n=1 Tax=Auriscalpium vulgare TaxID=40419 RepID=A0ACB8R803_9AGAM|nr:hypothetical protein FA95DRAFT_1577215 [Auriscalpium vulgare]
MIGLHGTAQRERFKQRCIDRDRAMTSNDDGDMDMLDDEEENEAFMLNDERHSYRVSYELDVGSSLDPDWQDIAGIEDELLGQSCDVAYWEDLEAVADDTFSLSDLEDEAASGAVTIDGDVEMS